MGVIDTVHTTYVHSRRVRVLSQILSALLPSHATVLDVGCGDGLLSRLVLNLREDIEIHGLDVLVRPNTHIPVKQFDGNIIPADPAAYDAVMFVDVLHHTPDPMALLREAKRVARQSLIIKDHRRNGLLAGPTLRFMDYVGNARHGVSLPYNYWTQHQWFTAFTELGLKIVAWNTDLPLYPPPASWIFGRSLHFVARLDKGN
ncbi:MAG: class I SAM-dependent methyltransferase [Planctomycetota bacterium]|nr:class I SAM-dependent methyltransferase [Planctomycetota bacterium]